MWILEILFCLLLVQNLAFKAHGIHSDRAVVLESCRLEQSICDLKHWIIGDYVKNEFKPKYLVDKLPLRGSVPAKNKLKSQQLYTFTKKEARQCLKNRKIWFIGDSYIRCFYNGFLDVLRGNYASFARVTP